MTAFFYNLYITLLRYLDGTTGQLLRYRFYKKKLKHLGKNVIIDTGVFITGAEYISIGDNTHIDKNCILVGDSPDLDLSHRILLEIDNKQYQGIKGEISIGKECHISQNTMIYGYGGVYISDYCCMSAGAKIYSLTTMPVNPFNKREITTIMPFSGRSPTLESAVVLEENSWIGIDTVVEPGVTIGKNTFVESFSDVVYSIESNSIASGKPAVKIKKRYKDYENDSVNT